MLEKRFVFLISWIHSDKEATDVNTKEDLLPEFEKGSDSVFTVEIMVDSPHDMKDETAQKLALSAGKAEAFDYGYNSNGTVHVLLPLDEKLDKLLASLPASETVEVTL